MALAEECVVRSIAGTDMGVDALCIGIVVPRLRAGGVEVEFEIGANLGDAARPRGAVALYLEQIEHRLRTHKASEDRTEPLVTLIGSPDPIVMTGIEHCARLCSTQQRNEELGCVRDTKRACGGQYIGG